MKIKEFSNLTEDDLITKEKQLKKELFDMESHRQMGRVEKPASFRNLRRDIARILTVINERRISNKKISPKEGTIPEKKQVNAKRIVKSNAKERKVNGKKS